MTEVACMIGLLLLVLVIVAIAAVLGLVFHPIFWLILIVAAVVFLVGRTRV